MARHSIWFSISLDELTAAALPDCACKVRREARMAEPKLGISAHSGRPVPNVTVMKADFRSCGANSTS